MEVGLGGARTVAILVAMVPELRPLQRALRLREVPSNLDGPLYEAQVAGRRVIATTMSMGTAAAADTTGRVLALAPVDHVLVLGIAGGTGSPAEVGQLVHPSVVRDEVTGDEHVPHALTTAASHGVLLTAERLHPPHVVRKLASDGVVALDMETAAVARVCVASGVRWSVLRARSDGPDDRIDERILGLAKADGRADVAALVRFALTSPWRLPQLARLGRGMRRAVSTSTDAAVRVLTEGWL